MRRAGEAGKAEGGPEGRGLSSAVRPSPAGKALGMARGTRSGQRVAHVLGAESGRGGREGWAHGGPLREDAGAAGDQAPPGPRTGCPPATGRPCWRPASGHVTRTATRQWPPEGGARDEPAAGQQGCHGGLSARFPRSTLRGSGMCTGSEQDQTRPLPGSRHGRLSSARSREGTGRQVTEREGPVCLSTHSGDSSRRGHHAARGTLSSRPRCTVRRPPGWRSPLCAPGGLRARPWP